MTISIKLTMIAMFSKFLVFALKFKCDHWQQILTVVFLYAACLLDSFTRKCLQNTQFWIAVASQMFFKVKNVPFKKKLVQLTKLNKCFYLTPQYYLRLPHKDVMRAPNFVTQTTGKKWLYKARDLINLVTFSASLTTIG